MNTELSLGPARSGLVWFRRDLRAEDHAALSHALRTCARVHCAFVFDTEILDPLPRADRRVAFIRDSAAALDARLRALAGRAAVGLIVVHGRAREEVPRLAARLGVQVVFAHHDDEPASLSRDARVRAALTALGIELRTFKDHVVFERREVLSQAGTPYTVFTPYRAAWLARLDREPPLLHAVAPFVGALAERPAEVQRPVPAVAALGFAPAAWDGPAPEPGELGAARALERFRERITGGQEPGGRAIT